jgi:phage terminase small subunit
MKKLEPRKRLFIQEFLKDLNASQAAKRAGYSKKTAYSQGQRLLKNVEIKKAIDAAMRKREEKTEITAARVLQEIAILAFSDLKDYIEINDDTGAVRAKGFDQMPPNASRALESITENRTVREDAKGEDSIINEKVTFKLHSKTAALEALCKHLGLFEKDNRQQFPANLTFRFVYAEPKKEKQ